MLYKFRLWCETENAYVYKWSEDGENAPTKCPNDTSHVIDTTKTAIVEIVDQPKTLSDGILIVSPTYGFTPEDARWKGALFKAIGGETTFFDQKITTEIRLQGGLYNILNYVNVGWDSTNLLRDFVEFSIIDKDDVLELFDDYDLTPGEGILELVKFVENAYVLEQEIFLDKYGAFPVTAGLYFRIAYNSVGISPDNDIFLNTRFYWLE